MTVSGTTTFNLTVAEIVTEARGLLGIQDSEEPLQAHELVQGIRALNMMLKAWQSDGIKTWTLTEGSFALVQSDYDYVFGSGGTFTTVPLEITDVRITRNSQDLPMNRMSREEYFALPVKSSEGYPTQFYYDYQREGGTLYVWPAPDSTAGTIKFTYRRKIMDAGDSGDTLDVPDNWMEAVTYNLAKRLLPYYPGANPVNVKLVLEMAVSTYAVVANADVAEGLGSLMITPYD